MNMRRRFLLPLALIVLAASGSASADPNLTGRYRLVDGPDVASQLELTPDGRFRYFLSAGALDEWTQGRWERKGSSFCLITEPKPVPPEFSRASSKPGPKPSPKPSEEQEATLLVTWPDGQGIPGVDFRIGFDSGEPLEGYTQYYGWTMPADDPRIPRWIELSEPIHGLRSPRFDLAEGDRGKLHIVLIPNDLGLVDFTGACLEPSDNGVVLHRKEGDMRFVRIEK